VRELRNAVQRVYVMAPGDVIEDCWPPRLEAHTATEAATPPALASARANFGTRPVPAAAAAVDAVTLPIGTSMAQAERALMLATLRHFNHHKERTAAPCSASA
jgi:two-component system, NtrC family, response regulator AtoC